MQYCRLYGAVLVFCHAVSILGQSTTPTWTPSIIGIGFRPSSTQTLTARKPWFTDGNIAGDCTDTERCALATACKDGKVIYQGDITSTCPTKTKCFVLTMYERPPNVGPVVYNYGCRLGWPNTVYRDLAAADVTSNSAQGTRTPESQASPSPTRSRSNLAVETSAPQDSTESTTPDETSGKSESKAWIAGAVIGPIAGLALIGGGVLFWLRRRRNQKKMEPETQPVHELDHSDQRPVEKYSHIGEKHTHPHSVEAPAELSPESRPVELPTTRL